MSNYCKNCYELTEKLEAKEQKCEELKKTLTEIKKIVEKTLWTYSNLYDVTIYNMFDKILQKIKECEAENE